MLHTQQYSSWQYFVLVGVVLLFFGLRLPALTHPYYQDEYKNALVAEHTFSAPRTLSAHPPLAETIFRTAGALVGAKRLRLFFVFLSICVALLTWHTVRSRMGEAVAWWSLAILTLLPYNLVASLMVDLDGQVLPLFFIALVYSFDRVRNALTLHERMWWGSILVLCALAGLLTKLSFILALGALALEVVFLYHSRIRSVLSVRAVALSVSLMCIGGVVLFFVLRLLVPSYTLSATIEHALYYTPSLSRQWGQVLIQSLKALFYLGPLIMLTPFVLRRSLLAPLRIFISYAALVLIFYLVLFDFSHGAIDKYLMALIVPFAICVGAACAQIFRGQLPLFSRALFSGAILSIVLALVHALPHSVLPLHPKSAWFQSIVQFRWNILNPFTGGSGPQGFYLSFLFIAATFIAALLLSFFVLRRREWRAALLTVLLTVSFVYSAVFALEFLWGVQYGSAPRLLRQALAFIAETPTVEQVITYNDSGAYELQKMGKYGGRFYANPAFEDVHRERFSAFGGHYLVVDLPHLNPNSFYGEFFSQCKSIFSRRDRQVSVNVYYCK